MEEPLVSGSWDLHWTLTGADSTKNSVTLTPNMEIGDSGLPPTMYDDIERVALATKNVRSHLAWIRLRATVRGKFYVGGTTIAAEIVSVEPYKLTQIESRGPAYVGAACIAYETVEIFPRGPLVLGLVDGAPLALADAAPLALMN